MHRNRQHFAQSTFFVLSILLINIILYSFITFEQNVGRRLWFANEIFAKVCLYLNQSTTKYFIIYGSAFYISVLLFYYFKSRRLIQWFVINIMSINFMPIVIKQNNSILTTRKCHQKSTSPLLLPGSINNHHHILYTVVPPVSAFTLHRVRCITQTKKSTRSLICQCFSREMRKI